MRGLVYNTNESDVAVPVDRNKDGRHVANIWGEIVTLCTGRLPQETPSIIREAEEHEQWMMSKEVQQSSDDKPNHALTTTTTNRCRK